MTIRAKYLVGCDGGSSVVRKQLGFKMEGEPHILEMRQAMFYCPDLYDHVRAPRARHYNRIDDHWTLMIVQDSRKHFTLHAVVESDEDMATLFEEIVGTPVEYEMVHCAKWVQRLLLAEHYLHDRVFIAGDAAHLVIPTGGLGMNTGVGDAIDISWKLAATLRGWGGPRTAADPTKRSGAKSAPSTSRPPAAAHPAGWYGAQHGVRTSRTTRPRAGPCWPTCWNLRRKKRRNRSASSAPSLAIAMPARR